MSPIDAITNSAYICRAHFEFPSQRDSSRPFGNPSPYFANIVFSDLRQNMTLSSRKNFRAKARRMVVPPSQSFRVLPASIPVANWIPSLRNHIVYVVLPGSQEKMRRIAARRIIAFVQHPKTFRNRSYLKGICDVARSQHSSAKVNPAVSLTARARPMPALIGTTNDDSHPKTIQIEVCGIHKKNARQSKCARVSSGSRPNWKVVAGSCSTGDQRIAKSPMEAKG